MKRALRKQFLLVLACMFLSPALFGQATGRVVINEYMPWTSNGCGTASEFIELLNFGPGAVDIGCYIITTGQYSITIPPRTILQPGEFYVLAGQDFLPSDCANVDSVRSGVRANLNWNTCNCTNATVPTSGDGLMVDGGSSNTPLVLFDPALNIADAVVRSLPTEPTTFLTTPGSNGCAPQAFDIGTMPIRYEQLGMSAGRGNSFARITDGDCGWVKDPKQSANASNNRDGDLSDIQYSFSLINAMTCDSTGGRISIHVEHMDYASVFPMSYTVANDTNADGRFDENDDYATFIDSTPPSVDIIGLPVGHYRVTVSSVNGCYLRTFEFSIFTCTTALSVQLEYFNVVAGNTSRLLTWKLQQVEQLNTVVVEKSANGRDFLPAGFFTSAQGESGAKRFETTISNTDPSSRFRLKVIQSNGGLFYSPIQQAKPTSSIIKIWPNPAGRVLSIRLRGDVVKPQAYSIYDVSGKMVQQGSFKIQQWADDATIDIGGLLPGMYQLKLESVSSPINHPALRFVKQ